MTNNEKLLAQAVVAMAEGLDRAKLECEATEPNELDLFKNLVEWDLYGYITEPLTDNQAAITLAKEVLK